MFEGGALANKLKESATTVYARWVMFENTSNPLAHWREGWGKQAIHHFHFKRI